MILNNIMLLSDNLNCENKKVNMNAHNVFGRSLL